MSNIPEIKNNRTVDSNYVINGNDDVINVDTSNGPVVLTLPNIKNNELTLFYKKIYINDIGNNASNHPIRIVATNDTINGFTQFFSDVSGGALIIQPTGINTWMATSGTKNSAASEHTVFVSSNDTSPGFLSAKLIADDGIELNVDNILGFEFIKIKSTAGALNISNTAFVSVNGDDDTGAINNWSKPFRTISAANALVPAGTLIYVFPGDYNEVSVWCQSNLYYELSKGARVFSNNDVINDGAARGTFNILGHGEIHSSKGICVTQNTGSSVTISAEIITASDAEYLFQMNGFFDINAKNISLSNNEPSLTTASIDFGPASNGNFEFNTLSVEGKKAFDFNTENQIKIRGLTFKNSQIPEIMNWTPGANGRVIFQVDGIELNALSTTTPIITKSGAGSIFLNSTFIQSNAHIFRCSEGEIVANNCSFNTESGCSFRTTGASTPSVIISNSWIYSQNGHNIEINSPGNIELFNVRMISDGLFSNIQFSNNTCELRLNSCNMMAAGTYSIESLVALTNIYVLNNCSANLPLNVNVSNVIVGTLIVIDVTALITPPNFA